MSRHYDRIVDNQIVGAYLITNCNEVRPAEAGEASCYVRTQSCDRLQSSRQRASYTTLVDGVTTSSATQNIVVNSFARSDPLASVTDFLGKSLTNSPIKPIELNGFLVGKAS